MKGCAMIPIIKKSVRNERGSAVYSLLGVVIIALVIIYNSIFLSMGTSLQRKTGPGLCGW